MKLCRGCNGVLPLDQFWKDKTMTDGFSTRCKACKKSASQERDARRKSAGLCVNCGKVRTGNGKALCLECCAESKAKRNAQKELGICISCGKSATLSTYFGRLSTLSVTRCDKCLLRIKCNQYGITVEELEALFSKQNQQCVLCAAVFESIMATHIDHCHTTEVVRGLLCGVCNRDLGHFEKLLRNPKTFSYLGLCGDLEAVAICQ